MKMLSSEVKTLLDKLYNLRGEDSVILTKMNKEREEAIETGERTKNEKTVLLDKIAKLTEEEKTLQEEGDKLSSILSSINKEDFANVLDRLNIDFDPSTINAKITSMLPDTIKKVVEENQKATEELESVEAEMNNAITKVEELGIRKDEALSNQEKLNEYFRLALEGNINITRDEITNLLEKFNFNEDEQREAAKILMFPEDALYEYDATYKSGGAVNGKTITEVLMEAKKESTSNKEKMDTKELDTSLESSSLEDIFDKVIDENKIEEIESPVENENVEVKEEHQEEVKPLFSSDESLSNLSNENKEKKIEKEDVIKLLESLNVNTATLVTEEINKLLENYDEELIKKNVSSLKESNIDLNVINSNIEILLDKELKAKVDKLLSIGKEARDISLTPGVLKKYDLQGLNNTISVLELSGLDPKKVPLMAY